MTPLRPQVGELGEAEVEAVAAACEAVEASGQCLKAVSRLLLEGERHRQDGWL